MAGTIQIKRSANTATPSTLEFGEVAWSSNGGTLHIGREESNTSNVVAIGGVRTPGTLIANQALVANSSSEINEMRVNTYPFRWSSSDLLQSVLRYNCKSVPQCHVTQPAVFRYFAS